MTNSDNPPLDPLNTDTAIPEKKLGDFLRSEREKRQITIEQVASATKINVKLLHALEADNYDLLPARPFVRGFVANYSRYLGLNAKEIVEEFDEYLATQTNRKHKRPDDMPHIFVEKSGSVDRSRMILSAVMGAFLVIGIIVIVFIKPSHKKKRGNAITQATDVSNTEVYSVPLPPGVGETTTLPSKPVAVTAVAVTTPVPTIPAPTPMPSSTPVAETAVHKPLVIAPPPILALAPEPVVPEVPAVIATKVVAPPPEVKAMITPSPMPTATPKAVAEATPAPQPTAAAVAAVSASTQQGTKPPPIPENEVQHRLMVKALDDSWVKYQSDDRPILSYLLRKDKIIYVKARESIRFLAGNPTALEYSYNRGALKKFDTSQKKLIFPVEETNKYQDKLFTE